MEEKYRNKVTGEIREGYWTQEHAASSYNQPVLIIDDQAVDHVWWERCDNPAAVLGRKGGSRNTDAQNKARAANGAKGGRPVKRVQLINPWSGALPEDKNLAWDEIRAWAQGHVHPDDLPGWLRRARQAFRDNDGAALGTMIIGS